jgi:regulatory protein
LKLLARRELSEAQVRQRLARKGHSQDDIDGAVAQLRGERALDDERVAGAIARTETAVRGRGRARVQRRIERAGIARSVARQAVDRVFNDLDSGELLAAALDKRLRGRPIADDREMQRLYRYLIGQGFEPEPVFALLDKRRKETPDT